MPSLSCCGYTVNVEELENRDGIVVRRVVVRRGGDEVFDYTARDANVRMLLLLGFSVAGFDAIGKLGELSGEDASRLLSIIARDANADNVEPWLPLLAVVDEEAARGVCFTTFALGMQNIAVLLPLAAKVLDIDAASIARLGYNIVTDTVLRAICEELGVLVSEEKAGLCEGRVAVLARAIAMMTRGHNVVVRCVDGKARVEVRHVKFMVEERGDKLALVLHSAPRLAGPLKKLKLEWLEIRENVIMTRGLVEAYAAALLLVDAGLTGVWEARLGRIVGGARGNPHLIVTMLEND